MLVIVPGKKHKKEKKKDKKKKKKKDKKRAKADDITAGNRTAVTNQYGAYGIINDGDFYLKQPEFRSWVAEHKALPGGIEQLSKYETMKMFGEYAEDYNTATLPHKKYYDLDKYEKEEAKLEAEGKIKRKKPAHTNVFDDEKARQAEIMAERGQMKDDKVQRNLMMMKADTDRVEDMKHQKMLERRMQDLYKSGNTEEAKKIMQRLDRTKEQRGRAVDKD